MSVVDEYTNDSKFTNNRVSAMNRSCYDFGFQIISYEHHGVSAIETRSFLFIQLSFPFDRNTEIANKNFGQLTVLKYVFEKRTKTIGGNCMKSLPNNKRKL